MYCNKCGNEVFPNQKYCNKCGNLLPYNENNIKSNNKKNVTLITIPIGIVIMFIVIILIVLLLFNNKKDYFFSQGSKAEPVNDIDISATSTTKGKYKTAIITDNVYSGIKIDDVEDANDLIRQDSENQKDSSYPKQIIEIENDIIQKYSITAVNLKEMEVDFAKELENVIGTIYNEYPKARGYLTNLTLTNLNMSNAGVIAQFMPIFIFGQSNTSTTRPWVIKTQVQLNAKYFLNPERIDAAVESSSKAGHFPKNATKYSPVAHEFGHYLSFIALLNSYSTDSIVVIGDNEIENYYKIYSDFGYGKFSKKMLDEAYQNYLNENEQISFDEWRGQISQYALAKDESGEYIYDETIAEAFHDIYLNKNNASKTSKYIVEVLKKYIES